MRRPYCKEDRLPPNCDRTPEILISDFNVAESRVSCTLTDCQNRRQARSRPPASAGDQEIGWDDRVAAAIE